MSLEEALWQDDGRMSEAVCFNKTRIPVYMLIGYLKEHGCDQFLEDYSDLSSEQIMATLDGFQMLVDKHFNVPVWQHEAESQANDSVSQQNVP